MKQRGKNTVFWSGLTVMNSLFVLVLLWSVVPFRGETLPHAIEQLWTIPFSTSAMLVSLFCALLAAGIMALLTLYSGAAPAMETERSAPRSRK